MASTPLTTHSSISTPLAIDSPVASTRLLNSKENVARENDSTSALASQSGKDKSPRKNRHCVIGALVLAAVAILFLVIFLPVFFLVVRKNHNSQASSRNPSSPTGATTGGDGSIIKLANGTEFTYHNPFGGFWVQDPADPFSDNAQPNSWTPPLNTTWDWSKNRIYGVNLGGWLVLEPFITPSFYQKYPTAVDEFTLSQAMAADTASGGLSQLETHYDTFITELDIAQIAGAGLNFIRIPLAFWAIETWEGEPFLAKTSWKYFLRVLEWARKYGLRVCLDLHAVPGSQNGYNHSGKLSSVNFMLGNMGLANAERTLYYIRVLTEFISQPQYRNLVPVFGIVNEALVGEIGIDQMTSFYLEAHTMIRNITGLGEGHGPYIAIHDGFQPLTIWENFLQGSDRVILDEHNYFSFGGPQLDPVGVIGPTGIPGGKWPLTACNNWGPSTNQSRQNFGVTFGGEFSGSPNDCGLFLKGVNITSTNPFCPEYDAWESYNSTMKAGVQNFIMASFDALGDWFFWTWKIAPSQAGRIEAPLWSYQLGLEQGWIPQDPRTAVGMCASVGASEQDFSGAYQPWQTGATPSSIPASSSSQFPWPPMIQSADVPMSLMPTYTNTAPIITMPPDSAFTAAPSSVTAAASGWFDQQDNSGGVTAVAGCAYPDEYDGIFSVVPTAPCTGPTPTQTPPP